MSSPWASLLVVETGREKEIVRVGCATTSLALFRGGSRAGYPLPTTTSYLFYFFIPFANLPWVKVPPPRTENSTYYLRVLGFRDPVQPIVPRMWDSNR